MYDLLGSIRENISNLCDNISQQTFQEMREHQPTDKILKCVGSQSHILRFITSWSLVQLGSQNPFERIPVDQTVAETVNKATQTSRGTKGVSLNSGAISTYYLTAEYHICKKDETTAHGKEPVLKADRNLFAHMLLVAQSRKLKINDVLSHPLGPLPMALASPDGMMRTTNKSSFGHELQNDVYPAANIPQPCCCIIDGMNSLYIPGPGGYGMHGWKLDLSDLDGGLVLDWMEGKPAPEIVLELLVCVPVQDYVYEK
ncbi:hypothetical protein GQR58_023747 [Nymphon striatum]|nr:hypothetical protein GQR58_023747 [Nymphon striatum]